MRYWLLDVLACPMCKAYPLELHVFEERAEGVDVQLDEAPCELTCSYKGVDMRGVDRKGYVPTCKECMGHVVVSGILVCPSCGRWYPIMDEIPHMLPDKLRNKDRELEFLSKFRDKVPGKVASEGKPYHL